MQGENLKLISNNKQSGLNTTS